MIIYFAGTIGNKEVEGILEKKNISQLFSYYYEQSYVKALKKQTIKNPNRIKKNSNINRSKNNFKIKFNVFLDSGAFSAWTKNIHIDIYQYIDFIKEHQDILTTYAVLDSINDPKQTLKNQRTMEREKLSPLPCYHYGEDEKYLRYYIENYDYLALGGMVPVSTPNLKIWLDRIFSTYICNKEGFPKIKVHGFGMTSVPLMFRYPWYSVDSTSWLKNSRHGKVFIPKTKNGSYNYSVTPISIFVSHKNPSKKIREQHIDNISPGYRKILLKYFEEKGIPLGESKFHKENRETYVLKDNEKWIDKYEPVVETIIQRGIINHYVPRDLLNADFFINLQNEITRNKKPFLVNKKPFF